MNVDKELEKTIALINDVINTNKDKEELNNFLTEQYNKLYELQKQAVMNIIEEGKNL